MYTTEAFCETGTEGTHWCLYDNTKNGYSGLVDIEEGDYLTILTPDGTQIVWQGIIEKDTSTNRIVYPYYSRFLNEPCPEEFKKHLIKINGLNSMPYEKLPQHCRELKDHILTMTTSDCEKYIYKYHSQQLVRGLWVHWLQKDVYPDIWANYFLIPHKALLN